jgi:hypothetical protein
LWSIVLVVFIIKKNYELSTFRSLVATILAYIVIVILKIFLPFL